MTPENRGCRSIFALLSARSLALGRMLLSLARRAMDEVLTKISLLRDHLPSPGNGGWKGRRIERDQEEGATAGGRVCISHDESITAVNLTALRSLIPRLHCIAVGSEGRVTCTPTGSHAARHPPPDATSTYKTWRTHSRCTSPTWPLVQLANSLSR